MRCAASGNPKHYTSASNAEWELQIMPKMSCVKRTRIGNDKKSKAIVDGGA